MQKSFTDMHGRPIGDGAEVYFNGFFPMMMPVLDDELYIKTGDKCPRNGFADIEDGVLKFVTRINGRLWSTGLTWEFDNEPCHDLILTEEVELCYQEN